MDINYLDDERKKLWAKIREIEAYYKKNTPELEDEVRQIAQKLREYSILLDSEINALEAKKASALNACNVIEKQRAESNEATVQISANANQITSFRDQCNTFYNEITTWRNDSSARFAEINAIYANNPAIAARIQELEAHYSRGNELLSKIEQVSKFSIEKHSEIELLYNRIHGVSAIDPNTGKEVKSKGLKDELEDSYKQIKANQENLQESVNSAISNSKIKISEFEESKSSELNSVIAKWQTEYVSLKQKIEGLLPNALTAGLSYAYSSKKNEEIKERESHASSFRYAIIGMFIVSCIPMAISIHGLLTNVTIDQTIERIPRLVLGILPLYIPVLWIASSSSMKLKLSKRLIEEYAHKEALSKTYEGLSTQINSLEDSEATKDLRQKLLYNILEISAENPGKLISDYNKSDHPVMEALDKSVQLANAVDKVARIPGISKLAKVMANKADQNLQKQAEKAQRGLGVEPDPS